MNEWALLNYSKKTKADGLVYGKRIAIGEPTQSKTAKIE